MIRTQLHPLNLEDLEFYSMLISEEINVANDKLRKVILILVTLLYIPTEAKSPFKITEIKGGIKLPKNNFRKTKLDRTLDTEKSTPIPAR